MFSDFERMIMKRIGLIILIVVLMMLCVACNGQGTNKDVGKDIAAGTSTDDNIDNDIAAGNITTDDSSESVKDESDSDPAYLAVLPPFIADLDM